MAHPLEGRGRKCQRSLVLVDFRPFSLFGGGNYGLDNAVQPGPVKGGRGRGSEKAVEKAVAEAVEKAVAEAVPVADHNRLWREWNERREAAAREGREFTEPPPEPPQGNGKNV